MFHTDRRETRIGGHFFRDRRLRRNGAGLATGSGAAGVPLSSFVVVNATNRPPITEDPVNFPESSGGIGREEADDFRLITTQVKVPPGFTRRKSSFRLDSLTGAGRLLSSFDSAATRIMSAL